MIKMKKVLICVMSIILLLGCFSLFATAAETAAYDLQNENVEMNEEFTMEVSVVNNPGIISLRLTVNYDSSVLELLSVTDAKLLNGFTTPAATISSPYTLRWADSLATSDNTANGNVVTLKFKALTAGANTTVTVEHVEARNSTGEKVVFAPAAATVTVAEEECNHVFTNYVSDNNATCTADGTKTAYCDNGCGEKKTIADEGSKLAHTFNKEVKNANTIKSAATCTEDAVYFLSCDCGTVSTSAVFADADTALGHDMTDEKADAESHWTQCSRCEEITGKAAHADADDKIEADASAHWYTCSCGTVFGKAAHSGGTATETEKAICETCGTAYGTIDSCTHDGAKEVRNAVAATCSKDGYSGDTYCKECGILLREGNVIKSTGKHSYKLVKYEEATPDKNGYKLYECADCGATKEEAIFYSINTGVEDLLTPAAAVVLLSGAVFFCSNKLRKKEENI